LTKTIADLILDLWKLDLDTTNSCQDNPKGFVWIEFSTACWWWNFNIFDLQNARIAILMNAHDARHNFLSAHT
jgi:hypothetical protein